MSRQSREPLAVFYEHPDWFRPLFAELDRREIGYVAMHAGGHTYDPQAAHQPHAVVFNRMSPSAYLRGNGHAIPYTTGYLSHLERLGTRVINGAAAWRTEISKADQLSLLTRLGLRSPTARVIHDPVHAPGAATGLRFPVIVKPNVGGSGAGVRRFDTAPELEAAVSDLDLGIDGTALVQEYVPARDGSIVRVEVLDGSYLYAIRIYTSGDTFDLCPADVCLGVDGRQLQRSACPVDAPLNGLRVEAYTPPASVISAVERIAAAAGIEIGGVEYMLDDRDGELLYYDINALSNFVADAPTVIGFDPFERLVDWLEIIINGEVTRARQVA